MLGCIRPASVVSYRKSDWLREVPLLLLDGAPNRLLTWESEQFARTARLGEPVNRGYVSSAAVSITLLESPQADFQFGATPWARAAAHPPCTQQRTRLGELNPRVAFLVSTTNWAS